MENILTCPLCNKNCYSLRSISKHIKCVHYKNPKDILFEKYPQLFNDCKTCGIKIKYYKTDCTSRQFCSKKCYIKSISGKNQSKEVINKRIKNTNQEKKEKKRKETCLTKYGVINAPPKNPIEKGEKISKALKGKKHPKEQHIKVIETKRKNGTLNHSEETKRYISEYLKKKFNSEDFDKSIFLRRKPKNNSYNNGHYKGIYYRSSYEKKFLEFCEFYNIKIISAETNMYSVKYEAEDGITRTYFPDFYLPDLDLVIEIKPISMYDYGNNMYKFDAMCSKSKFMVITEEDYLLDSKNWNLLYESILYA
jgi:hypothetical protein